MSGAVQTWPACPHCGATMARAFGLWYCPVACLLPPSPNALTGQQVFLNVTIPRGPLTIDQMVEAANAVLKSYAHLVTKTKDMSGDNRAKLDEQVEAALVAIGYDKQDARRWMRERLAGGRRKR
ncbi:MAG TPA: hypothetical protein VFA22_07155 [Stellaceae bacterium]|nr:hypothetical protein [Stellaceae bacterium]